MAIYDISAPFVYNRIFGKNKVCEVKNLKDILRVIFIILIGLFVAIIAYPVLHETGHAIMSMLCGGTIVSFSLFPLPYVICNISGLTKVGIVLSGLSGIIFPSIIAMFITSKRFYLWYGYFSLKCVVWLSLLISIITSLLNYFGISDNNDDMVKVLQYWENGDWIVIFILMVLIAMISTSIIFDHPVERIIRKFE